MGVRVEWDNNEKTILKQIYEGKCTVADFHTAVDLCNQYLNTVDHQVSVIVDMRKASLGGSNFLSARNHIDTKSPTNTRIAVIVGAPSFLKALANISQKVLPRVMKDVHFVNSYEEAYAMIEKANAVNA